MKKKQCVNCLYSITSDIRGKKPFADAFCDRTKKIKPVKLDDTCKHFKWYMLARG